MRMHQHPVIYRRHEEREIAGTVGHAGGGEGDEEGFLSGEWGWEGREGGEDVVG